MIEMLLARDVLTAAASAALLGTRTSDVLGAAEAVIDANPSSAPDEIHGALRAELFEEVVYRPQ